MLNDDIQSLSGIGKRRAELFYKMDIRTVKDLLYFFPRAYEDRSVIKEIDECAAGETVCVKATVFSAVKEARIRKNFTISTMTVFDDSGDMKIKWYNNRYVKNAFRQGGTYIFYGKITYSGLKKEMENPLYELEGSGKYTGRIVPVYPLTGNLTQKMAQSAVKQALEFSQELCDYLPQAVRNKYKIAELGYALKNIHFPEDSESCDIARKRLIFEELFLFELALFMRKADNERADGTAFEDADCINEFENFLPFAFTKAQKRVVEEIARDLSVPKTMNRLLQGDVGSGKTAVAAAAVYMTVKNGFQAAVMAPTEILARQHAESFTRLFEKTDFTAVTLTGGMKTAEKRQACDMIRSGEADIIIGTHAIFSDGVDYKKLGLVIVDEQHRFGVKQRNMLIEKGINPNVLVMSATPIPRTLALVIYGDLDISLIDEMPPGHKSIKTYAVQKNMRRRAYGFLEKNVRAGRQAYIVCPLVEETEALDLKNASELYEGLVKAYPDIKFGLLHGKMKAGEKDDVMQAFVRNEISVLVSTTVIEVGVNVPNSTLMLVENAERFGLNQLHQLRGRVGRGREQSFCVFIVGQMGGTVKKRMETLCSSNDGFYIAERDLELRGPGDFFGTRQHGLPMLKIANIFTDTQLLKEAQKAAQEICSADIVIDEEEKERLNEKVEQDFYSQSILN